MRNKILASVCIILIFQLQTYYPKVVLQGTIEEGTDYFGRRTFSGKVVNEGKKRADFVY